jgi:hypothetical protein
MRIARYRTMAGSFARNLFLIAALFALATIARAESISLEVQSSSVERDKITREMVVTIELSPEAKAAFEDFTQRNVGRSIEIRLGTIVLLKARLMAKISGGVIRASTKFALSTTRSGTTTSSIARGRHLPALHRPPPRARGDQPAGLRGPAHGRPQGARAGEDARRRRPQRADHRPLQGHRRRGSRIAGRTLAKNAKEFGVEYFNEHDKRQGIVHIIGPEQGFTLPGTTIVCGDSHTSTHGAFGALAHGIGTSEVEHVLATQTLIQKKAKNMLVQVDGKLPDGVTAKDIILAIIGEIGTAGGTGHVIEYAGEAIRACRWKAA